MNTFDELLYQIDGEDTFESEFSSFLTDDDSMYAEGANKVVDVTVDKFKSLIEKAKKVDKRLIIAIAAAATLAASIVAIIRHNTADKRNKAKLDKAMTKINELANESKVKEKRLAKEIKKAETLIAKLHMGEKLQRRKDIHGRDENGNNIGLANDRRNKIREKFTKTAYKKHLNREDFKQGLSAQYNSDKKLQALKNEYFGLEHLINDCVSYVEKLNELKSQYNIGATKESVYSGDFSEYSNIMESAMDKFLDDEISFGQLVTVSGKAAEKYGVFDESYEFNTDDDEHDDEYTEDYTEYENILDAICEKYNNNEISPDEALYLIEKASDKYLDDDDDYLEYADNDTEYNEEYNRLVDAICEKYNNNEISPDDTILLLEKAAERYSVDETEDETDDLIDSMLNDD